MMVLRRCDRDPRGLDGDEAHDRNGMAPKAQRGAEATAQDGRGQLFCSRWNGASLEIATGDNKCTPPENSLPPPLPDRHGYGPIALCKAGRGLHRRATGLRCDGNGTSRVPAIL